MCRSRGGGGGGGGGGVMGSGPPPPSPEKSQIIGFLGITGSDPQKNHKATKPAFNVGPSEARQRNAIRMAFLLRADDGQLKVVFGSSLPLSTKKTLSKLDPL